MEKVLLPCARKSTKVIFFVKKINKGNLAEQDKYIDPQPNKS